MDVTIAIVAYNALDKLRACLDSLAAQQGVEAEVVVVDNASTEPVTQAVRDEYPWVKLDASPENLGFAKGTNRAVAAGTAPRVLLLNPDTELPEPDTLARLIATATQHGIDVLGCRMILTDGTPQDVSLLRPRAIEEALDLLHLGRPNPNLYARADDAVVFVDFVSGACLLTTRAIWVAVGELDPGYFMYLEDADWCRRAIDRGLNCAASLAIWIRHHEGSSYGDQVFLRREHYWRSLMRYVRLHDPWRDQFVLRLALVITSLLKLPAAALTRNASRAARLQLLRAQLGMGLRGS